LFFLKDFFSSLAAGVNPFLPMDPAAEGEHHHCVFLYSTKKLFDCSGHKDQENSHT
jgi:hypothetical protein